MIRSFLIMTLLSLATISVAYAQSEQPIEAKVPFAFAVHHTALSAGNYRLTYNSSAHILSILGLNQNSRAAFVTALPETASGSSKARASLVFECYEKTCYLARVWQGGARGLGVPQGEHQRTLAFETRVVSITIPAK
jgi:hypothetical protein